MQNDEGNLSDNLVELYKNIKQFCELCTQLKCYKNVTNCYKIVTPTFQKFFSLIQKIPTEQNLSTTYPHSIHILSTHLSTIDTWEIPNNERRILCKF